MVFFPFYAAAGIPSNIIIRTMGPSRWLFIITLATGPCTFVLSFAFSKLIDAQFLGMTLMGSVKTFGSLLVFRSILVFAEGGIFPGIIFYITLWYRRYECNLHMAIFFSAATLDASFGGLLGRLISMMGGIGGRPSRAWIFILEALAMILVAFLAKFLIHDSPET